MDKDSVDPVENLLENSGYMRCQIEFTEYLMTRQREVLMKMKTLRREIEFDSGLLKKNEKIRELMMLSGQNQSLDDLWRFIMSLQLKHRQISSQ